MILAGGEVMTNRATIVVAMVDVRHPRRRVIEVIGIPNPEANRQIWMNCGVT
jgi:hypothetical protein